MYRAAYKHHYVYFYFQSSATYADGYRSTAVAIIRGPNTKHKGEKTADQIIKR